MLLYPPPPRKQPDVWRGLGAPHGMGIRRTVSNEGSQRSRKTVNRVHAQSPRCLDPLGPRESARQHLASGLLSTFTRQTSVLLLSSPSPPVVPSQPQSPEPEL